MPLTIFLFHRDFRLEDHFPLQKALDTGNEVLPVFIFTPEQVGTKAPIKSEKSIQCMIQGLKELDRDLKTKYKSSLSIMYGDNIDVLESIYKKHKFEYLYETKDYTPYAKKREKRIADFCKAKEIEFEAVDDIYLFPPGSILTGGGRVYQKFTPFYETAKEFKVDAPTGWVKGKFSKLNVSNTDYPVLKDRTETVFYKGGRAEGLYLLKTLPENYDKTKDFMAIETSGLSVHHHFGTVSVRESYAAGIKHPHMKEFIRQLYWRDFYGHIMAAFDNLYGINAIDFEKDWPKLTKDEETDFKAWREGKTGIEIIDAGMNQLNTSGYMHNRARLVCASYLVKTLGIPWRLGERYFATHLLDYDITQNMMNWCFIASNLPFSEAPYRKHNPDSYTKRFDASGAYRDTWLD
jgi:deoxyribodipyrimidine photo-lyase